VQCINPFTEPIKLPAGTVVPLHPRGETVAYTQGIPPQASQGAVPEHAADLYDKACGNCNSSANANEIPLNTLSSQNHSHQATDLMTGPGEGGKQKSAGSS